MIRAWTICAAAIIAIGCKSGEEPVRGAHRGVDPIAQYQPPVEGLSEPTEPPIPEPREPEPVAVEKTPKEPERDLGAELKAAIGIPMGCVRDFDATRPTTIRISIRAIVRPSGMVIEPAAYGAGLSVAARTCIEQRVGTISLRPLDTPTSQNVSTVVQIEYEPPVTVESKSSVPEPELRNVRDPLPKRPEVAPSGQPIMEPTSKPISGGFDGGRPIQEPTSRKVKGPKPRAIDGYEVDENAQDWR